MSPLRVAVIGAGHLGRIHAKLLSELPAVRLVGVADPDGTRGQEVATACRARGVADYRELLNHIDAAVVATPTRCHHEIGMELLARGVHALIEKPLATSVAEADELIAAAAARDAVLQVGHVERFNPAFRAAAPVLREVKYIEARRTGGYTFRSTDIGVVLDLMIHDIDLVLALTGSQVRNVSALGTAVLGDHEDMAQARLELNDGCVVNLTASRTSLRAERSWNVFCPAAYAGIDLAARTVELVTPSQDVARRHVNLDGLTVAERKQLQEHLFQTLLRQQQMKVPEGNPLREELRDFVAAIQQHRPPHVTGEDGKRALAVAEMVMAAVDQHCWDGNLTGPVGPHAIPGPRILRDPRLPAGTTPLPRRKAG